MNPDSIKNDRTKTETKKQTEEQSIIPEPLREFYKKYLGPQGEDGHYTLFHDVLVAVLVVIIILSGVYAYTGIWPPVVVVESGSMQHSMDHSSLGVIDTGDIVMVKKVHSKDDITTWAEGKNKDYKTYGEYGDVIIYRKNGESGTPVIHRAIVYIRVNRTDPGSGGTYYFDVPEWGIYHNSTIRYYIPELQLKINYTPQRGHDGFLTKGDNRVTNKKIDQEAGIRDSTGRVVEQVSLNWVVGVARGELPWFGLIKLKMNHNEHIGDAPENSWTDLKISLFLLIGVPVILNLMYYAAAMKYGTEDDEEDEKGKGGNGKGSNDRSGKSGTGKGGNDSSGKGKAGGGKAKNLSAKSGQTKGKKGGG